MDEQYIIRGETLTDVANAIREKTGENKVLKPIDFAEEILNIDLPTEDYMRISDLLEYPKTPQESNYSSNEIAKTEALIMFYESLGGENDGEQTI